MKRQRQIQRGGYSDAEKDELRTLEFTEEQINYLINHEQPIDINLIRLSIAGNTPFFNVPKTPMQIIAELKNVDANDYSEGNTTGENSQNIVSTLNGDDNNSGMWFAPNDDNETNLVGPNGNEPELADISIIGDEPELADISMISDETDNAPNSIMPNPNMSSISDKTDNEGNSFGGKHKFVKRTNKRKSKKSRKYKKSKKMKGGMNCVSPGGVAVGTAAYVSGPYQAAPHN